MSTEDIDLYEKNLRAIFNNKFEVRTTEYAVYLLRADFKEEDVSYIGSGSNRKQTAARLQQSVTIELSLNKCVELQERGLDQIICGKAEKLRAYEMMQTHFDLLPKIVLEEMWGTNFKSDNHNKLAKYGDDMWTQHILQFYTQDTYSKLGAAKRALEEKLNNRNQPAGSVPTFTRRAAQQNQVVDGVSFDFHRKPFKDVVRELEIEMRRRSVFL